MAITIDANGLDLSKTLKSGQVFRYQELEPYSFRLHVKDQACHVWQVNDTLYIDADDLSSVAMWNCYFNTDTEPSEVERIMSVTPLLRAAYQYSRGIRFLRQDPFECLISFIISQQKRIPQIQASVELLCEKCGPLLPDGSRGFPYAQDISRSIIPQLRLGYRGPYVHAAAMEVADGSLVLGDYMYPKVSYQVAMQRLQRIHGVGTKIADCVALFALGFPNAFPVDTHIIKILAEPELSDFRWEECGDYAGLVQQYLYNYALYNGS